MQVTTLTALRRAHASSKAADTAKLLNRRPVKPTHCCGYVSAPT